jgi:hypothetical protein
MVEAFLYLMEAVSTSETSVSFYKTTRCNIPDDSRFHLLAQKNSSQAVAAGVFMFVQSDGSFPYLHLSPIPGPSQQALRQLVISAQIVTF